MENFPRIATVSRKKEMLNIAAILCLVVGRIQSYLGERYILVRLFRRENIPHLFGSDYFTKGTLRFVWHITTFSCWDMVTSYGNYQEVKNFHFKQSFIQSARYHFLVVYFLSASRKAST